MLETMPRLAVYIFSLFALFFSLSSAAVELTSITVLSDSTFDGGDEETAVTSAHKLGYSPYPTPGYYKFKYTNGYTGAEYFAYYNNMYNKEQFFNYAIAGTASTDLPDVLARIYQKTPTLDPTGLYVIFVGGHDIFQDKLSKEVVAQNIINAVSDMKSHGANYFMVIKMPILSDFPAFNKLIASDIEAANNSCNQINNALTTKINALSYKKNVAVFDMTEFSMAIRNHAKNVGYTDISSACRTTTATCSNPNQYIYWDDIHFSNQAHSVLGYFMKATLDAAKANW